ncbi:hypothetical protein HPB50_025261 [Hyalomma asiaticum]|uniref:Uncharacterized protein n=1 Tax=Hyalomma asiaticum TaxID=266040 RepID=A0ACB7SCQ9_HYAAI|nr:hypothetical protein HPB50_025261 [Hyalomma asiaticum]
MSSDVLLGSDGEPWPPDKIVQRQLTISWIQIITGIVKFYCVMCHCVFLMLIAVWMVIREVSRRLSVLWMSWYSDFKENGPVSLPFLLGAIHMTVMSKMVPQTKPPEEPGGTEGAEDTEGPAEDVSDENEQRSEEQSEVPDEAASKTEECESPVPTVSASSSGVCTSSSPPESPVVEITESESSASLETRLHNLQNQQLCKRAPCSISAVVEDKYACGLNRSTSSSAVSIEDLDDSSDDDGGDGFDERSKSTSQRPQSANVSCTGSWKLKSAFHRASGKSNEIQSCFPKSKAPAGQAPCPEKSKFSLGPVISHLRRVCSRTLSVINKELTECMSPQGQRPRSKKSETPVRDVSQVALSPRGVPSAPAGSELRRLQGSVGARAEDLSAVFVERRLLQRHADVVRFSGRNASRTVGLVLRGRIFRFPQPSVRGPSFRRHCTRGETAVQWGGHCADGNFEKGDSDWTTQNSQSNAFFNDQGSETNAFGTTFQSDGNSTGWEF